MLNMTNESKEFLIKNIPETLGCSDVNDALDALYDWIDLNGFADDGLYNIKGKQAQQVYDDLYISND